MPPNPLAADLDEIVSRAEPWLRRLVGERVFITGGTGFFGRWLLEALTWADDRLDLRLHITVLSRDPETFTRRASALATHRALDWRHIARSTGGAEMQDSVASRIETCLDSCGVPYKS